MDRHQNGHESPGRKLEFHVGREPFPHFIEQLDGLGRAEGWGRWSSDGRVRVRFRGNLPVCFRAEVRGAAARANVGRVITILAGACRRSLVFDHTVDEHISTSSIHFHLAEPVRTIELLVPDSQEAGGGDNRRLGLALTYISIAPAGALGAQP